MGKLDRAEHRAALAVFVRILRSRSMPADVGLPASSRRRTPGLRREEVAHLAGVGITWYTWFEQGRDINVSSDFLERLSRAFRLSPTERSHLFMLAHYRLPPVVNRMQQDIPETVLTLLTSLPNPAYIKNSCWDVLTWNAPAGELFSDFARLDLPERNLLRLVFTSPDMRQIMLDWEGDAHRTVAKFRLDYARAKDDPSFEAVVTDLLSQSLEFRLMWERQDVMAIGEGLKTIRHPAYGPQTYRHAALTIEGSNDLRLIVYLPIDIKSSGGFES
ncbi:MULTISPECIES: helix-turn-helix transcriptional regulator [unclassified Rhizobium]|uniref:helix-turn-helix transcriptional regulator n=1 Tax=unclassified Rhizobium TaxID=2613769 RepID=UPI0027D38372|nr:MULTISPECIES: helix-turn-helix transcriptional regulator [unclassified Rhizobium]MDH7808749.1 transcriptional regulator with XRE-family HTH domain [Rhizobium sp. AN67]MDQ4409211.1 helix-turn-helix transcriptional regulator [Rhizobium sp. AN63]